MFFLHVGTPPDFDAGTSGEKFSWYLRDGTARLRRGNIGGSSFPGTSVIDHGEFRRREFWAGRAAPARVLQVQAGRGCAVVTCCLAFGRAAGLRPAEPAFGRRLFF